MYLVCDITNCVSAKMLDRHYFNLKRFIPLLIVFC